MKSMKCACGKIFPNSGAVANHVRRDLSCTAESRFWAKVNKAGEGGCWLWTAALDSGGRGALISGRVRLAAHRVAWEMSYGPIPSGLCILHKCDVRHCVNPKHMFLGTRADNNMDKAKKGRTHNAVLTQTQAAEIKSLLLLNKRRGYAAQLARERNLPPHIVWNIKQGRTYKHTLICSNRTHTDQQS